MLGMRRRLRFLAPWAAAFALFTACGDDDGGNGEETPVEGEPGPEGETIPPEPEET